MMRRGHMMHGRLMVDGDFMRRSSKHDRSLISGRWELLRVHVCWVGVSRPHHDLLSGLLLNVDNEGSVVVHLLIVFMVITASLEDLNAIDDAPDVAANVYERYE